MHLNLETEGEVIMHDDIYYICIINKKGINFNAINVNHVN